ASLRTFWTRVNQKPLGDEILERRSDVRLRSRRFDSLEIPDQPLHDRLGPSLSVAAFPDRRHRTVQDVKAGRLRIEQHQLALERGFFDLGIAPENSRSDLGQCRLRQVAADSSSPFAERESLPES